jgi:hypothetical membrane protein
MFDTIGNFHINGNGKYTTMNYRNAAGMALLMGAGQFLICLLIAESLYPQYRIPDNYVSDLGVWGIASAPVFNGSVILFGILGILAGLYLNRRREQTVLAWCIALSALGSLGVGIFPETTGIPHVFFALLVFGFGGIAAIVSSRFSDRPFSYIAMVLGATSLIALAGLGISGYFGYFPGTIERLVLYPLLIWQIGFGGYLLHIPGRPPG